MAAPTAYLSVIVNTGDLDAAGVQIFPTMRQHPIVTVRLLGDGEVAATLESDGTTTPAEFAAALHALADRVDQAARDWELRQDEVTA